VGGTSGRSGSEQQIQKVGGTDFGPACWLGEKAGREKSCRAVRSITFRRGGSRPFVELIARHPEGASGERIFGRKRRVPERVRARSGKMDLAHSWNRFSWMKIGDCRWAIQDKHCECWEKSDDLREWAVRSDRRGTCAIVGPQIEFAEAAEEKTVSGRRVYLRFSEFP